MAARLTSRRRRQGSRRAVCQQSPRQLHAAVGALAVLEQRDDRAPDCDGGAVERVQYARAGIAADANVQASRLVVGGVRARRQLAVATLTRDPHLAVVLLG